MSEISVNLCWKRKETELTPGKFSSAHEVAYNDQFKVTADTAPGWGGSAVNTNPEQALAASYKLPRKYIFEDITGIRKSGASYFH